MRYVLRFLFLAAGLWGVGFFWFVSSLPRSGAETLPANLESDTQSTGIVALTGGGGRIEAALTLMQARSADRMLITGVNPDTRKSELAATLPQADEMFDCCVDIGQQAETTRGNALETRDWVVQKDYDRIIVVTTDYHLPRAIAEIRRVLPDTEVIAWPVPSRVAPKEGWLSSPDAILVLAKEYSKFIAVKALQILKIS